jgi:hypothetical protein
MFLAVCLLGDKRRRMWLIADPIGCDMSLAVEFHDKHGRPLQPKYTCTSILS